MSETANIESSERRVRLSSDYFKLFGASVVSNLGDGVAVIAYPWLASAITRSPLLIALVAVVQRLPWLVFSLPAGVITDRVDRRRLMIGANLTRAVLTGIVSIAVVSRSSDLPGPDVVGDVGIAIDTDVALYVMLLVATALLGTAEVLYDNTAQTFLPSVVPSALLEKANGRLWSAEQVANQFVGPPLGALLLAAGFAVPFVFDAGTFAVSAVLLMMITSSPRRSRKPGPRASFRSELAEGVRWLWAHPLLRSLAITLGLLNALGAMTFAVVILFAQEVLNTTPTEFALMSAFGAIGGVIGGWTADAISRRLGSGPSLWLTLLGGGATTAVIGLVSSWPIVSVLFAIYMILAVLWNVITVSLRQRVIPDELLGRVNSVYRFFGWGMMPIGALLGGLLVTVLDGPVSREWALRLPWIVAGAAHIVLFAYAAPRLTSAAIAAADEATGSDRPSA